MAMEEQIYYGKELCLYIYILKICIFKFYRHINKKEF